MRPADRLTLIPGTADHLLAELQGREALAQSLGVSVPETWPPDLYDRPAMEWSHRYLEAQPDHAGWALWYLVLRASPLAIGIAGFKGVPSDDGTVEVGYSILAEHQRSGYASEAVRHLLTWAFADPRVRRVIAETYPELTPSIRVLEKNGFRFIGDGSDERIIRFELTGEMFAALAD